MNAWSGVYRTLASLRLLSHLRRRPLLTVLMLAVVVGLSVFGGPSFAGTVEPSPAPSATDAVPSSEPTAAPSLPSEPDPSPAPTVTTTATETVTAPAAPVEVQSVALTEPDRWLFAMPLSLLVLFAGAGAASLLIRRR